MLIKPFPKVEDVHAIAIPLFGYSDLITANVYAVGKGPVTLIDTGPKFPGALAFVQKQLKLAGIDINDIERIIITHGHLDHFGLAASIRKAAGGPIECFIHAEDKWRVSSEGFQEEMWSEEAQIFMAMVDMPQREIEKVKKRFSFFKKLCDPLDNVSIMEDGAEFVGEGYHLRAIHTPGHSPGSICLYESRQQILFSGDHIIKHITPNPLMEIKRDRLRDPNYQSLKAYMNSLDKISGLDVRFVFPGHGEYIEDLDNIISTYKVHHRQRMDLVWGALKKKSRPLYYLIDDVFPYVPEDDVFLAISEILVHLEILINEGSAELADPGPPALYRAL
ncbi:MAG: MBL fold metallo-hydrolase [Deltaproteobacteria bacterium]|nr:MBL fold metallo-hydrolase [Deltaproteobacteria bacterium]